MEFWHRLSHKNQIIIGITIGVIAIAIALVAPSPFKQNISNHSDEIILPNEPTNITVYITGAIQHPGVYTLSRGARIQNAIKVAGGALPTWDPQGINLAKLLEDEDMIVVPEKTKNNEEPPVKSKQSRSLAGHESIKKSLPQIVHLNTANIAELQTLPGIGAGMANRILNYRKIHGSFRSIEEIRKVQGIGGKKFEKISSYLKL